MAQKIQLFIIEFPDRNWLVLKLDNLGLFLVKFVFNFYCIFKCLMLNTDLSLNLAIEQFYHLVKGFHLMNKLLRLLKIVRKSNEF